MERLEMMHQNRTELWKLKASEETYHIFEDEKRPLRPAEALLFTVPRILSALFFLLIDIQLLLSSSSQRC